MRAAILPGGKTSPNSARKEMDMKNKMRITGNRTVIGIICIVLALGITFGIAPLVNRFTDRKVEVVQVKRNVERGHLITEDDVELVKVGALNLSDRTVKNKKICRRQVRRDQPLRRADHDCRPCCREKQQCG